MHDERMGMRALRAALGQFATGVTVVTARAPDGTNVGVTASSFNSVSLEPPLVLWSLARSARSLAAFRGAGHFAVNVLAADQIPLSNRFATQRDDKFSGVECVDGLGGAPLLAGCAARFQCRRAFEYDGGDHLIFVGEVLAFDCDGSPSLLFHRGRYALPAPHPAARTAVQQAGATARI